MNFNEEYFKTLNYTSYLERGMRYKKMATELSIFLQEVIEFSPWFKNLDFGCATGFFIRGLRDLGYHCDGYDISEWAKEEASKLGINYVLFQSQEFDTMFAFDVFEHMTDMEIQQALSNFNSNYLIVRIPCSTDNGKNFHLEISRKDPTHINCKTKEQWVSFLKDLGYKRFKPIDLYTIYDSDGVMSYLCKKN